ncbi:hypothetical protein Droror1_Dr00010040 [Drosera rotundifolia]
MVLFGVWISLFSVMTRVYVMLMVVIGLRRRVYSSRVNCFLDSSSVWILVGFCVLVNMNRRVSFLTGNPYIVRSQIQGRFMFLLYNFLLCNGFPNVMIMIT